jgi:sensor histidine kinase regulating citrate/malate metabolism
MIRATLESTTDAIVVTDGTAKVTGFNEKYVEMLGLSREQSIPRASSNCGKYSANSLRPTAIFVQDQGYLHVFSAGKF